MRTLTLIGSVLAVTLLAGCASSEKFIPERSMKQIDSTTFELQLQQPWVEQVIVRDNARQEAIDFAVKRNQGMQPCRCLSFRTSNRQGRQGDFTPSVVSVIWMRLSRNIAVGFYTDEESKKEAIERNREQYGF